MVADCDNEPTKLAHPYTHHHGLRTSRWRPQRNEEGPIDDILIFFTDPWLPVELEIGSLNRTCECRNVLCSGDVSVLHRIFPRLYQPLHYEISIV